MIAYFTNLMNTKKKLAVGLMSGTSIDGIDAALVEIDGHGLSTKVRLLQFETYPYSDEEKDDIRRLFAPESSSVDLICKMNVHLGEKFAEAALKIVSKAGLRVEEIDFISSHGQTIYHMPEYRSTLQIGELAVIAESTGCVTIGDFRPSDMAVGGQGAPLVPFTDALLFRSNEKDRVLINIGGISNVTVLPKDAKLDQVYGFDTGPGNVLIDEIVKIGSNNRMSFDENGKIALSGTIHKPYLMKLLEEDPFIRMVPPKSTGRELYTVKLAMEIWEEAMSNGISFADLVATITQYTVKSILSNLHLWVQSESSLVELIISGGGSHNKALLYGLANNGQYNVLTMEDIGFSSDAKEAIAFAILGNEALHGNYNNLPSATGAKRPTIMGKIVFPGNRY